MTHCGFISLPIHRLVFRLVGACLFKTGNQPRFLASLLVTVANDAAMPMATVPVANPLAVATAMLNERRFLLRHKLQGRNVGGGSSLSGDCKPEHGRSYQGEHHLLHWFPPSGLKPRAASAKLPTSNVESRRLFPSNFRRVPTGAPLMSRWFQSTGST